MEGSDIRTLDLFSKLVGKAAFRHVVFVTTMWGNLDAEGKKVAFKREKELKEKFWDEMMHDGSYVTRFEGSRASAQGIISQLVGDKDPVVLQIQHELIDRDLELAATAAGSILAPIVEEKLVETKSRLQRLRARLAGESNGTIQREWVSKIEKVEEERDQAQSDKDLLKEKVGSKVKGKVAEGNGWQETLRTICTVLGLSLSIVSVFVPSCSIM
jgi:hypothetical protein